MLPVKDQLCWASGIHDGRLAEWLGAESFIVFPKLPTLLRTQHFWWYVLGWYFSNYEISSHEGARIMCEGLLWIHSCTVNFQKVGIVNRIFPNHLPPKSFRLETKLLFIEQLFFETVDKVFFVKCGIGSYNEEIKRKSLYHNFLMMSPNNNCHMELIFWTLNFEITVDS